MSKEEQGSYIERLAKLGYCWQASLTYHGLSHSSLLTPSQFITLAGLHQAALMADSFSKAYAKDGMRAYASMIQEPEEATKVDVRLPQPVSRPQTGD